jgi:hypothetical protein
MAERSLLEEILTDPNTARLLDQCIGYTKSRDREAGFEVYLVVNSDHEADKLIFSKRIKGRNCRVNNMKARHHVGYFINKNSQLVYPVVNFHTHPCSRNQTVERFYPSLADLKSSVRDYKRFEDILKSLANPLTKLDGYVDACLRYLRGYTNQKPKSKKSKALIHAVKELGHNSFDMIAPVRIIADCSRKEVPLLMYQFAAVPDIDLEKVPASKMPQLYEQWVEQGIVRQIRVDYPSQWNPSDLELTDKLAA